MSHPVISFSIQENDQLGQVINARDLHSFIQSKQHFGDWIKNRVGKYQFIENEDFVFFHKFMKKSKGRPSKEYLITINMAKELSMIENNEQGRSIRRYFIECEKRLNQSINKSRYTVLPTTDYLLLAYLDENKINWYADYLTNCCACSPLWNVAIEDNEAENIVRFFQSLPNIFDQVALDMQYLNHMKGRNENPTETIIEVKQVAPPKKKRHRYMKFTDFADKKAVCNRILLGKIATKLCRDNDIKIKYNGTRTLYPIAILNKAFQIYNSRSQR